MPYAIYPLIGFARIGNSPEFFIGREGPDSLGLEIADDGSENEVRKFKDTNYRVKRQGARFRIFDISNPAAPVEAQLPAEAIVTWSVSLANRKDAVRRPASPPATPYPVVDDPTRADRAISAAASVAGAGAQAVELLGQYQDEPASLGRILTDSSQRLIVLGGEGRSATLVVPPADIGESFYNNEDWFDDVGDGPVTATIVLPGQEPEAAKGAWVIVGPPDFAPPANGIVTMFDIIRQVALDEGWLPAPATPYFDSDIRPMIERAASLRHVEDGAAWTMISDDWAALSDPGEGSKQLRDDTAIFIREAENLLHDFELRTWQNQALDEWAMGNFQLGGAPTRGSCDTLTRVALDGAIGQGFFPGIEAGVNMMNAALYEADPFEFRLSHDRSRVGDLTALMALPWQADFVKCDANWWPAQRPNRVVGSDDVKRPWLRPWMDHRRLVDDAMKLGIMTPTGGKILEQDRDPVRG